MVAFEGLSGIKINMSKTELIPINIGQEEASVMAAILGCKKSSFPIKYLGLPLHDRKLRIKDWDFVTDKIVKKLPNWSGLMLSSGGRLTMVNSFISAVPLYIYDFLVQNAY